LHDGNRCNDRAGDWRELGLVPVSYGITSPSPSPKRRWSFRGPADVIALRHGAIQATGQEPEQRAAMATARLECAVYGYWAV
jgi:hypothetical protein